MGREFHFKLEEWKSGFWNMIETRKDEVKDYRAKVEEDAWSGFNQEGTNISNSEDGAWRMSKTGYSREECHEGKKKRMSPFLAVMNDFMSEVEDTIWNLKWRFRSEAESRWRRVVEGEQRFCWRKRNKRLNGCDYLVIKKGEET